MHMNDPYINEDIEFLARAIIKNYDDLLRAASVLGAKNVIQAIQLIKYSMSIAAATFFQMLRQMLTRDANKPSNVDNLARKIQQNIESALRDEGVDFKKTPLETFLYDIGDIGFNIQQAVKKLRAEIDIENNVSNNVQFQNKYKPMFETINAFVQTKNDFFSKFQSEPNTTREFIRSEVSQEVDAKARMAIKQIRALLSNAYAMKFATIFDKMYETFEGSTGNFQFKKVNDMFEISELRDESVVQNLLEIKQPKIDRACDIIKNFEHMWVRVAHKVTKNSQKANDMLEDFLDHKLSRAIKSFNEIYNSEFASFIKKHSNIHVNATAYINTVIAKAFYDVMPAKYKKHMPGITMTKDSYSSIIDTILSEARSESPSSQEELRDAITKFVSYRYLRANAKLARIYVMTHFDKVLDSLNEQAKIVMQDPNAMAEAPPEAPFGSIAFAPERVDSVPYERNTPTETDVYQDIAKHFGDSKKFSGDTSEILQQMLKKGYYKAVLHGPGNDTLIYRGMAVYHTWLEKAIGEHGVPPEGSKTGRFEYKPRGNDGTSSSWTLNKKTAQTFAKNSDGGETIVVMYAKASDNKDKLLMGPGGLYKTSRAEGFMHENEVVALGNISVYKIQWMPREKAWR